MDGPPEITSAQLHAGPGATSLRDASQAWAKLAADLTDSSTSIRTLAVFLGETWRGPSSDWAIVEVQRHAAQITTLADNARTASTAAASSATAFTRARTMITPPAIISANRENIAALQAVNVLGQHTPTIAALEAAYEAMWAHNTTVMHTYAAQSAAATALLPQLESFIQDLLGALTGGTITPQSSLGTDLGALLSSNVLNTAANGIGPPAIVQAITGFGFMTAFMQQAAAMQTIRDTITAPAVTVLPAAPPVAATAVSGAARAVGGLSAPRTWWATAAGLQTPSSISAETAASLQTPRPMSAEVTPAPMPAPLAATATGQRRTRDDPEYGERPRVMPRPPAGG